MYHGQSHPTLAGILTPFAPHTTGHSASPPRVIAVTGASGLIGSRLVRLLLDTGAHLRLLTRTPAPSAEPTTCIQGDLTDAASLQKLVSGSTHLIHLAGIAHTTLRSDHERAAAREINVGGTQKLIASALDAGISRLLLASSAHVYAGQSGIRVREDSPVSGDSTYAQMKLDAETAARQAMSMSMDIIIVRPCIVYGPGVRFNLDALMRAIQRGLYVHAGGVDPLRSFASVDTAAGAIAHLLVAGASGGTYNIADRTPVHLVPWVNHLAALMGVRPPRTLPLSLLRTAASILTPAAKLGLPAPLTRESLAKLTASFTLDVSALAETGFLWPDTTEQVLTEMVKAASVRK